ncbi:MAG: phosphatidylglycerol lysyltransferase domain-containing protein [Candidatus Nomurabacteria bacterium]|nr:phosphatidylglycerol lysyltransferase domain-containing protein [Candidatus Nomurabacteria bacterium]
MIPEFPQFKHLELSDREDIEKITREYPPYSDFNFTSMWSWDTKGEMQISQLNGNLVVKFADYLTKNPFLSFIGKNQICDTASRLIDFSVENYNTDSLMLVPGEMVSELNDFGFSILPDVNATDYIFSIERLREMHNWVEHQASRGIESFLKLHSDYTVEFSSIENLKKEKHLDLFSKWAKNKDVKNHTESNEYLAFTRFLDISNGDIEFVSLYKNDILIGFTAYEVLSNDFAIAHFSKADTKHHSAIYDILNWEEAKILNTKKVKYYNWEQDLGIIGLQNSKLKYKPHSFLSKFIIKKS